VRGRHRRLRLALRSRCVGQQRCICAMWERQKACSLPPALASIASNLSIRAITVSTQQGCWASVHQLLTTYRDPADGSFHAISSRVKKADAARRGADLALPARRGQEAGRLISPAADATRLGHSLPLKHTQRPPALTGSVGCTKWNRASWARVRAGAAAVALSKKTLCAASLPAGLELGRAASQAKVGKSAATLTPAQGFRLSPPARWGSSSDAALGQQQRRRASCLARRRCTRPPHGACLPFAQLCDQHGRGAGAGRLPTRHDRGSVLC